MVTETQRKRDKRRWWQIHDKDTYICPDCGRTVHADGVEDIEVHHLNGEAGKCVGLCNSCHKVRHNSDPEDVEVGWWKSAFEDELISS
jgi:hypothetical protein